VYEAPRSPVLVVRFLSGGTIRGAGHIAPRRQSLEWRGIPDTRPAWSAPVPEPSTFLAFSLAALVLLIIPGPAVLYIVARSVEQGRAAGLVSVAGVHAGTAVHIAAATLGLSALLLTSALAFSVVKYLGAAYLLYLGLRTLLTRGETAAQGPVRRQPLRRVFADGAIVEILNPKVALFFVAFLPQFVDPSKGGVATQIWLLGGVYVLLGFLSDGSYALLAARAGDWLRGNLGFARVQRLVTGGIYLALGAVAALSGSRSSAK
jgi:threonine/homoserine/homoserine lactone efflux protein